MRSLTSPFYSRNYGGLSAEQVEFLAPYVKNPGDRIMDPMSGQAHYLSRLASEGRQVYIGDINPGPLLLATLRDPRVIFGAARLKKWLTPYLSPRSGRDCKDKPAYCDGWIPDTTRVQLQEYAGALGLDSVGSPLHQRFWNSTVKQRFATAIPVLAAREIACYTASDNLTWLKKGGLQTEFDIYPILASALDRWYEYAREVRSSSHSTRGELHVEHMNAEVGILGEYPKPNLIITSPPYANRLDYTRLWAPELEVLASMLGFTSATIKSDQIGTTVVQGKSVSLRALGTLPPMIQKVLAEIRDDELYASASYYYPFFVNYALAIVRTFSALGKHLARGGRIIVFVRDTSRKDVLFPAGALVEEVLRHVGVKILVEKREIIVRHHVGLRRRNSHVGAHGLAQREWWIVMRKA